jgi:hypothetical protein
VSTSEWQLADATECNPPVIILSSSSQPVSTSTEAEVEPALRGYRSAVSQSLNCQKKSGLGSPRVLLTMHNGRQLHTNTFPEPTAQDSQQRRPQVSPRLSNRSRCSTVEIAASQTAKPDPDPRSPNLRLSNNDTRASRPVVFQHNTLQTAERHRLAAIPTPARPLRLPA